MDRPEVYVVDWRKDLRQLRGYLDRCGGYYSVSAIFRWSKKDRRLVETNEKTIVICPNHTRVQLELAYPEAFGGRIKEYDWESFPEPNTTEGETTNLHISGVPNDFLEADAVDYVSGQLSCIISSDKYKTEFKLRSRTSGEISGYGQIIFDSSVDPYYRKLCKLMLHNKPLACKNDPNHKMMVRCVWFKPAPVEVPRREPRSRDGKPSESSGFSRRAIRVRPVAKVDVSSVGVSEKASTAES